MAKMSMNPNPSPFYVGVDGVLEASGGCEPDFVAALYQAGVPVTVTDPLRVRQFARSKGCAPRPTRSTPGFSRPSAAPISPASRPRPPWR